MTTIKPALDLAARAVVAQRTEAIFRASGAVREGHFLLTSGRHGDGDIEKFAVLSDPAATSELCSFWAARMRGADGDTAGPLVDVVAGPTTGGIILAFETARQLGVRSIFAEEVRAGDAAPRREFRRGFTIKPGERVLLVDDILTTG
ncbi:MAG: phosphoribosyltransferase family protein, partial [Candidatus Limnocylindrales bacterium]